MPGHYVTVNNHNIFGYSRYIDLYNAVVLDAKDGDLFVELGSFLGQSTAAMAHFIIQSKKHIRFDAVDLFELTEFSDEPHFKVIADHGGDFLAAFKSNMEKAEVASAVNPVKASSLEAASLYEDRSVSFLMIDASHKYEDVCDDIRAWYPKIKLGGIISGDDYDWEEVAKAVQDTFKVSLPGLQFFNRSTWYLKKQVLEL